MNLNQPEVPSVTGTGVTWYHVQARSVADLDFMAKLFAANAFDIADCVSQKQLPTVVNRRDYLFAILHFPRFLTEKMTVVPRQLSIFVGERVVVTVYQSELKPLHSLFAACQGGGEMAAELLDKDSGDLLWRIMDALVDYLFPMLDKTLEALENIEDDVFDDRTSSAVPVNFLRRDITDQRRILFPLERLVGEIRTTAKRYGRSDLDLHYEDLQDRVTRVWLTLDSAKERVEIFKDTDFILSSEKTNKILAILTILFTLSIPVTVAGTLMGMNVPIPGGIEAGPWGFWGRYTTFWIVVLISTVPAGLMAWLFRRWRWI